MTEKATVHYTEVVGFPRETAEGFDASVRVGDRAFVVPVDHTSPYVSNGTWATTTPVVSFDPATGVFETANTIYVPN